jgi:hypothetical protein
MLAMTQQRRWDGVASAQRQNKGIGEKKKRNGEHARDREGKKTGFTH